MSIYCTYLVICTVGTFYQVSNLEKVPSFFLFNTVSLNGCPNKRGLELVTSHTSDYETSSEKFLYVLSDQVWWCNRKWFLSFSNVTSANLCKAIQDIIDYASYWIWIVCKEGTKLRKFENLENRTSFFDEIETFFIVLERLLFGKKNKNLIRNGGIKH